MFINCRDFYETEKALLSKNINIDTDLSEAKLVVKAHEKEIYCLPNELILAKVHRDNDGGYPFSKVDFLSHKLQEIIFPQFVPKIHVALFDNPDTPVFILQRIKLDKYHIAYNRQRQDFHQSNGRKFYYDTDFLKIDENEDIFELSRIHFEKVNKMQKEYSYLIDKYGLAFDHSPVNITWKNDNVPVSIEVHKCRRDYLFNLDQCKNYLKGLDHSKDKEDALIIINRIEELL